MQTIFTGPIERCSKTKQYEYNEERPNKLQTRKPNCKYHRGSTVKMALYHLQKVNRCAIFSLLDP